MPTITLAKASAVTPDVHQPAREEGCDRCGVDQLDRPLRLADVRVDTSFGPVLLCHSHHVAVGDALAEWSVTDLR